MNTTAQRLGIHRQTVPFSFGRWQEQHENEAESVIEDAKEWMEMVARFEEVLKKNVYDNPEAAEWDFRKHRHIVAYLISRGDEIALHGMLLLKRPGGEVGALTAAIAKMDGIQEKLLVKFAEWHAPIGTDSNIPTWITKGLMEAKAGQLVEDSAR